MRSLTSAAKQAEEKVEPVTSAANLLSAALKRCATQNQLRPRLFQDLLV